MARLNITPTRASLSALRARLKSAQKGHRLLKDKRDELMRRFLTAAREALMLRAEVDEKIRTAQRHLQAAAAVMGEKELKSALLLSGNAAEISVGTKNVMSVVLPEFRATEAPTAEFFSTNFDFDAAADIILAARGDLLRLAELEKAAALMSAELERTRRRVNALEYVIIPNYIETIRYIRMKLEENERAANIRMLKIKDAVIAEKFRH